MYPLKKESICETGDGKRRNKLSESSSDEYKSQLYAQMIE